MHLQANLLARGMTAADLVVVKPFVVSRTHELSFDPAADRAVASISSVAEIRTDGKL